MMNKSNSEELIGVLWLILTVLLFQNDISWWITTLILGIVCQIASVVFSILNLKKTQLKKAVNDDKKTQTSAAKKN